MASTVFRLVVRNAPSGGLVLLRPADLPEPPPGLGGENGRPVVCLKAFRRGKGFISHYLVPLDPLCGPLDSLEMIHADGDVPVQPAPATFSLTFSPVQEPEAGGRTGSDAVCGVVVENAAGRFLKVREAYKGAFSLAYIDLESGEIRRRQQSGPVAVLRWALSSGGSDPRDAPAGVLGWLRQKLGRQR